MNRSSLTTHRIPFVLTAVALLSQLAAAQSIITNGGFEDAQDFNSWTIERAFTGSLLVCDSDPATAHNGNRSAHFGAHEGQPDILSKRFATVPGLSYRISFWIASDNIAPDTDSFVGFWGDELLFEIIPENSDEPLTGFPYTVLAGNLVAPGPSTELAFYGYKRFGTFRLDDVDVRIAPAGNTCHEAPDIIPNFTYTGDLFSATHDTNAGCEFGPGRDVWYKIEAPCNTTLTLDTCGSTFNTALSLWSGECGSLSQITCNDNAGGSGPCPGSLWSYLSVPVTAGSTYYIRVAGFGPFDVGAFVLHVNMPLPTHDDCANATPISVDSTVTADLNCATTDGSANCVLSSSRDVWYSYEPSCSHTLQLDTCDSTLDTVLSVYTGDCSALQQIACDDDDLAGHCANNRSSWIEVPVTGGERYLIRVAMFGSAAPGSFTLNARTLESRHDSCATALPVGEGSTSFDGRCAQNINGIYCNEYFHVPGTWFIYTAACSGSVFVDFCDTAATDTVYLSAFAGNCGDLYCIGSGGVYPTSNCPQSTEEFSFDAVAGESYWICYTQYQGVGYGPGTITIRQDRPANDSCANAEPITDGTYTGSTTCAAPDGSASCGSSNATNSVWYTWSAACDGTLTLDTCGSAFDTVLSVYRGGCGAFQELACNDDSSVCGESSLQSSLSLPVTAGEVYTIRLSGFDGWAGAFTLNVQSVTAANFACDTAAPLVGDSIEFDGTCADGIGGRFCNSPTNGPGIWYEYTTNCPGPKTLTFCRTGGPPRGLFSVFTGDCGALTCISSRNLTSLPQFCPSGVSVLTFNATAGVTYRICYTQFLGTPLGMGKLAILGQTPVNDVCAAAATLQLGTNSGSTACATAGGEVFCFHMAADVWFRYTAPADGQLHLDTCGSSFDTAFEIFFDQCGSYAANCSAIGPTDDCNDPGLATLDFEVTAGRQYFIRLGGVNGDNGAFVLNASLSAPNDICELAQFVSAGATYAGNLSIASSDGAATCSPSSGDRDVWYRWQASNCSHRLMLDTCGSTIDTVLSIHTGGCGALTPIACNDNAGSQGPCPNQGGTSYLSTPIAPGQQYWIRVAGANGAAGPFTLHVNEAARNVTCPDARPVFTGVTNFDGQCGAIDVSGTPVSCGRPGQATLWFQYRARCSGTAAVDLCGSNYDTSVSAYSGACGSLTELACNDNAGSNQCSENPFNSYIEFAVQETQVYTIRVSSFDDEISSGRMTITCLIPCPADLNRDGLVDLVDLAQLLAHFGLTTDSHADGDITLDGVVDLADLAMMLADFGTICD